jgi:hypothetical protein
MANPGLRQQPRATMGGVTVQTSDCSADITAFRDVIDVSFEAGETTTYKVQCPVGVQITGFYASVTKALAATDAGTIQLIDNTGTTQATISFPASSSLTTESTQNPTPFSIPAGSFYRLTWQKATAGGKAKVCVTGRKNGNG